MLRDFLHTIGTACIIAGTALYFLGPSTDIAIDNGDSGEHDIEMENLQVKLKRTEEELAKLQMATSAAEEPPKDVEKDPPPTFVQTLLLIEAGTTSSSISYKLEQAGIIDNAATFEDYITKIDLYSQIKIGEYQLDSSMSHKDIVKIITNKK